MFGPKRKEVVGGWRRLHNEELHNLYVSPYIIKVIKSRRMRWAAHEKCIHNVCQKLEGKDHLEDLDVDGKISDLIVGKQGGKL
jgi:hypothetical protein